MKGSRRFGFLATSSVILLFFSSVLSQAEAFFQKLIPAMPAVSSKSGDPVTLLLKDLQAMIATTSGGVDSSNVEQVKELMVQISNTRQGDQRQSLSGEWELIYTTEKEINFFKTSWPFAKVSSITQTLDLHDDQIVQNYINFEGGARFAVTGSVQAVDDNKDEKNGENSSIYGIAGLDRVAFSFNSATALVWNKSISLPPTGTGWFDTMFCNKEYRLSCDSRGDFSIFRRIS
jgi:hypothetical protein